MRWFSRHARTGATEPRHAPHKTLTRTMPFVGMAFFVVFASLGIDSCRAPEPRTVGNEVCVACHDGINAPAPPSFEDSAHGELQCETCHGPGFLHARDNGRRVGLIDDFGALAFEDKHTVCAKCHADQAADFLDDHHFVNGAASCMDCHDGHGAVPVTRADQPDLCAKCHEGQAEEYLLSSHVSPGYVTCGTCHGVHGADVLIRPVEDNSVCMACHNYFFSDDAAIMEHTFHPVDPGGTGASRCTHCHMPPLDRLNQEDGAHDHTLLTIPPSASNDAIAAGIVPTPPNSCAGITGCHDGLPPGEPVFDVDDSSINDLLQRIYDSRYGD